MAVESSPGGQPGTYLWMQTIGDLVGLLRQRNVALWATNTDGQSWRLRRMQNDGTLMVFNIANNPFGPRMRSKTWRHRPFALHPGQTDTVTTRHRSRGRNCVASCRVLPRCSGRAIERRSSTSALTARMSLSSCGSGSCPKFLGFLRVNRFPGAHGGEDAVCIERIAGRARPQSLPLLPPALGWFVVNSLARLTDREFWWTCQELGRQAAISA